MFLQRGDVRAIAGKYGIDIRRAEIAVAAMDATELAYRRGAGATGRRGARRRPSTVTISTTTIIIALLVLILLSWRLTVTCDAGRELVLLLALAFFTVPLLPRAIADRPRRPLHRTVGVVVWRRRGGDGDALLGRARRRCGIIPVARRFESGRHPH